MSAQFLIATSSLKNRSLQQSVIYLCHHEHQSGGLGLVINKTMPNTAVTNVLEQMGVPNQHKCDQAVLAGGPHHAERGMIIYRQEETNTNVGFSYSKQLLEQIAQGDGPHDYFLALGHTNWNAGQLQSELQEHQWLLYDANSQKARDELLFFTPIQDRYQLACKRLGFHPQQLSWQSGHA